MQLCFLCLHACWLFSSAVDCVFFSYDGHFVFHIQVGVVFACMLGVVSSAGVFLFFRLPMMFMVRIHWHFSFVCI